MKSNDSYKLPLRKNGALNTSLIEYKHLQYLEWAIGKLPIAQLAYHHFHQLLSIPICNCGGALQFKGFKKGYTATCGQQSCRNFAYKKCLLENKGVENVFQLPSVKSKIKEHRDSLTVKEKTAISQKTKDTCLKNLGVEYPSQSPKVIEKRQNNNLRKYGVKEPIQLPHIQNAIKEKHILTFGVDYPMQAESVKEKARNSRKTSEDAFSPGRLSFQTKQQCEDEYEKCRNLFALSKKFEVNHNWLSRQFSKFEIEVQKTPPSAVQQEIFDYVSSLRPAVINDRTQIYPKEIDILSGNLGIEVDGIYWHSYNNKETYLEKHNHFNKRISCLLSGIGLLRVTDIEWNEKRDVLKSVINARLGIFNRRVFARQCTIKPLGAKEANDFLKQNHLQGQAPALVKLGLFFDNQLISIATFAKSRYGKYDWELIRSANLLNTQVIGGFSKLLAYFRRNFKGSIVSYCDLDKFTGQQYEKNGFIKIDESLSYYYWHPKHGKVNRLSLQKHKLKVPDGQTTQNHIFSLGYRRYWTGGVATYVIK